MKRFASMLSALSLLALVSIPASSQQYKMQTPIPPGIASPSKVETRLGTLRFTDGFPDKATAEKLHNNLDFQRAVQAYLMALPAVSQIVNRDAILTLGPKNTVIPIFENLMDSRSIFLTPNTNTPYSWAWLDLKDGPLVLEVPPNVLGTFNDLWFRWVAELGITGADKGAGGKYLVLPPGYKGDTVQTGYVAIIQSPTFNVWIPWRSFVNSDGDPKPGVDEVKKFAKIYSPSQAANPPPPTFVNMSGKPFNTVAPGDFQFWALLHRVVQEEPSELLDPIRLGYFASIGIEKGKPFAPDARMKKILGEAAAVGDATARAIAFDYRQKEGYYYQNSAWQLPFVGGYKFELSPGVQNLDGYIFYYFMATGVTPAMEQKMVGQGSQYAWAARRLQGQPARWRQELSLALAAQHPGQKLLVGDCLR